MATLLSAGQKLVGKLDSYVLLDKIRDCIWRATPHSRCCTRVIVKLGPTARLDQERDALQSFRGHHAIRQMLDEVRDPPALILEYLNGDVLSASNAKQFERQEVNAVARTVLEALAALHSKGWVHTGRLTSHALVSNADGHAIDIKPDNILYKASPSEPLGRVFKLADCGDSLHVPQGMETGSRVIGATIFRSPEAMLNINWGPATDIWSFGATVSTRILTNAEQGTNCHSRLQLISLLWGQNWHMFKPLKLDASDEMYPFETLRRHDIFFGPFPKSYVEIADPESLQILTYITETTKERRPFRMNTEIHQDDTRFLCKIMKLDPRDRPSAAELLADEWFASCGTVEAESA